MNPVPSDARSDGERTAHAVLDGLTAHIATVDERGRIVTVNARWRDFAQAHGAAPRATCEGADYLAVCDQAAARRDPGAAAVAAGIRDVLAGRIGEFAAEYPCHSATEERWFTVRVAPFPGEGAPRAVISHEDISARVKAEAERRHAHALLDTLLRTAPVGFCYLDRALRFVRINDRLAEMNGVPAEAHLGRHVSEIVPTLADAVAEVTGRILATGEAVCGHEFSGETAAAPGVRRHWAESWYPVRGAGGEVVGFGGVVEEVTERKRLEREVLEISAHEQRRIGHDLHDDLCQWLAGTALLASALAKDLARESHAEAARAQKIVDALQQANARARTLAHGLAPAVIEWAGLTGALRELATHAGEMFRIRCSYDGPVTSPVRDADAALHLYRIAQEAIHNAVRHGRAREVRVVLQPDGDRVTMRVRDDGCGVPQPLPETRGMGLRTMRYRAGVIDATLEIRPGEGGGTEVVCTFPEGL